jgi:asparagine synthase (glutamine-hydrolysing)
LAKVKIDQHGEIDVCGITGLISLGPPLSPTSIRTMTHALRHRGPDDEGYIAVDTLAEPAGVVALRGPDSAIKGEPLLEYFAGRANLYLGHRRLAILDLSTAGHQPMRYGDHLWIVYNGEIYNYVELRKDLRDAGYEFKTGTDTEVILAAYDRWGEACVTHFNGDWAFCILDTQRHILFLSRDRYGIKPLYFFRSNGHLAFASEIKAILSLPFVPRSLNREKAFHYHVLFCKDHTEETLFDDIYQLMPGQCMSLDIRSGETRKWWYYTLSSCPELGEYDQHKATTYASDVRDLLFDAVRLRLRADVPIGTCLSGGLDSSAVVAIMAKILGKEVSVQVQNTFTASFPGQLIDESHFARLVADRSGAISHFIYPSQEGYWRTLPAILYHQDEPFGGPSVYSQWEVMREASKHVKVVLDGQGGDEVFAGYRDYRVSYLAQLLEKRRMFSLITELWCVAKHAGSLRKASAELKPLPFFVLGNLWKQRIYRLRYHRQVRLVKQTFGFDGLPGLEHIDRKFKSDLNELLLYYMTEYSLPYLLRGEDRNSMAHSIEARVPFTDHRIVDYVFSLPAVYKIRHGWTKWLLRLAVKDLLPPEIVWRKDKLGFATPQWASRWDEWDAWMQQNFQ